MDAIVQAYLRRRYTILFYSLVVTLVSAPVVSVLKLKGTLIESLLAACLLAAILPTGTVRSRPYLLVVMVVVWLARPVTAWLGHPGLSATTLAVWTLIG